MGTPIKNIAEAVMKKYNDAGLVEGLPLYFVQAPQGMTGNWATFNIITAGRDEIMGDADDCIHIAEIQFNIYTDSADGGLTLANLLLLLEDCFDWSEIEIAGYHRLKIQPLISSNLGFVDSIWEIVKTYELGIIKE